MKKISVIIPLYNLEELIGKCIRSTVEQDLPPEEYEVIVVDDGSTDGSLAAAHEAARGHDNIRIYSKPNEGLSMSRNYATDRAEGRYVLYLDTDDYLMPNVLGQLAQTMERERLDMLCFDIRAVDEQGEKLPFWSDGMSACNGTAVQQGRDFLLRNKYIMTVWSYLYDREFLNRHHLRMMPVWHEDEEFTPRALYFAKRIRYTPLLVYNYLQRGDSFKNNYNPRHIFDLLRGMKSLSDFAESIHPDDPQSAQHIRKRVAGIVNRAFNRVIIRRQGDVRELIRFGRETGLLPLTGNRFSSRIFLLNHAPSLYIFYYRLHKRR